MAATAVVVALQKSHKSFDFELQEPIKAFNCRLRSYLSTMGGRVVSSGAEVVDFVRRNGHAHFHLK